MPGSSSAAHVRGTCGPSPRVSASALAEFRFPAGSSERRTKRLVLALIAATQSDPRRVAEYRRGTSRQRGRRRRMMAGWRRVAGERRSGSFAPFLRSHFSDKRRSQSALASAVSSGHTLWEVVPVLIGPARKSARDPEFRGWRERAPRTDPEREPSGEAATDAECDMREGLTVNPVRTEG